MQLKIKRNNAFYDFATVVCYGAYHIFHRVDYYGDWNVPKKGPALFLPKHQALRDIILEGIFLRYKCKRHSSWIMKAGLPGVLSMLGGIKVKRPRDMHKIRDRQERRKALEEARDFNQRAMEYVEWLYTHGEIVVVHPEGTRNYKKMGNIRMDMIEHARQMQEKHKIQIPAVPVGIEYERLWTPQSKVCIRAGEPVDISDENIENIIHSEIKRLSGL
jgi:1-acyl-sn-glycerol-3-phosphate acyltransferase